MECTTKVQTTQQIETTESIENKEITRSKQADRNDDEARMYQKYMAQQEALYRLERIKTNALGMFRR